LPSVVLLALDPAARGLADLGRSPAVKLDSKKAIILVALAFLAMSIWNNPGGTAENFSNFLGDVGGWIEDFIEKATEFFEGLFA
jgi:hypothetical protein